jgi:DNA modification methylase
MPRIGEQKPSVNGVLKPFWQTLDDGGTARLYLGDVLDVLRRMPSKSVQCTITSPPYWGLRDYGTGTWTGGRADCDHISPNKPHSTYKVSPERHAERVEIAAAQFGNQFKDVCGKCGARRTDAQLGGDKRPDCLGWARGVNCAEGAGWATACHVCRMVLVFRELRRVLRDDAVVFLNYGDTYAGNAVGYNPNAPSNKYRAENPGITQGNFKVSARLMERHTGQRNTAAASGLPSGNLVGIPWRVALALQADGWVLRQDIIWAKPSPMPESVRNRCTKAHEYLFLLTKSMRYFCDMESIKVDAEPAVRVQKGRSMNRSSMLANGVDEGDEWGNGQLGKVITSSNKANKRSVWTISSRGYEGAHFATFPEALVEPCVKAGTSEYGACAKCGCPWRRVVEEKKLVRERPNQYVKRVPGGGLEMGNSCANGVAGVEVRTLGWEPGCECHGKFVKRKGKRLRYLSNSNNQKAGADDKIDTNVRGISGAAWKAHKERTDHPPEAYDDVEVDVYVSDLPLDEHPVVPCVVLDPFVGSGTAVAVAVDLGRAGWGIDLSEGYLRKNAVPRVRGALLRRSTTAWLAGRAGQG